MNDIIAENLLKKYNQTHLLNFKNELAAKEKQTLLNDISKVDFDLMKTLYKKACDNIKQDFYTVSAIDNVFIKDKLEMNLLENWRKIGTEAIKQGKYAIITMAGGQGSRLGHSGPKGTFYLNVLGERKSIFEILIDKLKDAKLKYGVAIQWYIMTSLENNDDTVKFFEDNSYFNYGKENISFFKQGVLPMLDESGRIILESKSSIKFASDGNGGVFKALENNILQDMKLKGIEWVYISGVDNILVNFVDDIFLGGTIVSNKEISCKSVIKKFADEKVGVICKKNNKPYVIEYTEIPSEMLIAKKDNGELLLSEANIVSNIFSINVLDKIKNKQLPYHVAKKKCAIINNNGDKEDIGVPNAFKFETFIFDSYTYVDDIFIMRVKREEEFAPVKNKVGEDSPETAQKSYNDYYMKKPSN